MLIHIFNTATYNTSAADADVCVMIAQTNNHNGSIILIYFSTVVLLSKCDEVSNYIERFQDDFAVGKLATDMMLCTFLQYIVMQ